MKIICVNWLNESNTIELCFFYNKNVRGKVKQNIFYVKLYKNVLRPYICFSFVKIVKAIVAGRTGQSHSRGIIVKCERETFIKLE